MVLLIKISIQVIQRQSQSISILSRTLESKYMSGSKAVMPRFKKKSDSPQDAKCISNQQTKSLFEYCKSQTWQQSRQKMYNVCRESQVKRERNKYKDKKFHPIFWKRKILELMQTGTTHSFRNVALKTTIEILDKRVNNVNFRFL